MSAPLTVYRDHSRIILKNWAKMKKMTKRIRFPFPSASTPPPVRHRRRCCRPPPPQRPCRTQTPRQRRRPRGRESLPSSIRDHLLHRTTRRCPRRRLRRPTRKSPGCGGARTPRRHPRWLRCRPSCPVGLGRAPACSPARRPRRAHRRQRRCTCPSSPGRAAARSPLTSTTAPWSGVATSTAWPG